MRVGELARKTGLTIRTLHYYEEIGLLVPGHRTESGHRVYGPADILLLQQIVCLRQLGFELADIRRLLDTPDHRPADVLRQHAAHVRAQAERGLRLSERLERMAQALDASENVPGEEWVRTIQEVHMYEKYYSKEQLDTLAVRRESLGDEGMRKAEADWADLIAAVRAEMDKGTPPDSPEVQALAARWQALVEAFTGGDPGIQKSLNTLYAEEGVETASRGALDPALFTYIGQAMGRACDS